jgi:hypothetical protein
MSLETTVERESYGRVTRYYLNHWFIGVKSPVTTGVQNNVITPDSMLMKYSPDKNRDRSYWITL